MIKRIVSFLIISILILCVCSVLIYFINPFSVKTENIRPRLFGFDIYRIPSKSMQPLLYSGDYILVSNIAYMDTIPKTKDVIIFNKPDKNNSETKVSFIKRVIAVGGDTVEIKNGKLRVNNILMKENYIAMRNNRTPYSQNMKLTTVPESHVFVLGDNRDNSSDSRIFGSVGYNEIIAKASSILYGINNRSGLEIQ